MAIVTLLDGRTAELEHDKAIRMWYVLQGETEPENEAQEHFIANIKNLYLNWRSPDCPTSYLDAHRAVLTEMSVNEWWSTRSGFKSAPGNPHNDSDRHTYQCAEKIGAWEHSRPSDQAKSLQDLRVHTLSNTLGGKLDN